MSHSPAPWRALNAPHIVKNQIYIADSDLTVVCLVQDNGGLNPLNFENARLIAAAPELLALLTEVVSELSDTDDEGLIEHTDWMMKARAVIAKATGQEAQDQLPF